MAESGRSGASSWIARCRPSPGADSIASRTPCSSLTSVCVATRPKVSAYQAIASSRSATAMPTWSIADDRVLVLHRPECSAGRH